MKGLGESTGKEWGKRHKGEGNERGNTQVKRKMDVDDEGEIEIKVGGRVGRERRGEWIMEDKRDRVKNAKEV